MKIDAIVGGKVDRPATVNVRSAAASQNEMATEISAAEDVIDPRSAAPVLLGPGGDYARPVTPKPSNSGWFTDIARGLGYRIGGEA